MSLLTSFGRWLHLKHFQFEITYTVYMFTPWEKFFLYTILFLLTGLTFIATVLYLPQHLVFIVGRAWFYMHGEQVDVVELTKGATDSVLQHAISSATTKTANLAAEAVETVVREL